MAFIAVTISINPTWIMRVLFSVATFYVGLLVLTEGVTYGSSTLLATGTQLTFVVFIFMTLGSLVTAYSASLKKDVTMQ